MRIKSPDKSHHKQITEALVDLKRYLKLKHEFKKDIMDEISDNFVAKSNMYHEVGAVLYERSKKRLKYFYMPLAVITAGFGLMIGADSLLDTIFEPIIESENEMLSEIQNEDYSWFDNLASEIADILHIPTEESMAQDLLNATSNLYADLQNIVASDAYFYATNGATLFGFLSTAGIYGFSHAMEQHHYQKIINEYKDKDFTYHTFLKTEESDEADDINRIIMFPAFNDKTVIKQIRNYLMKSKELLEEKSKAKKKDQIKKTATLVGGGAVGGVGIGVAGTNFFAGGALCSTGIGTVCSVGGTGVCTATAGLTSGALLSVGLAAFAPALFAGALVLWSLKNK